VAVDLRKSSVTFGKWVGEIISSENKRQMWIPEGFAHGFVTLSDTAEFLYKTTNYYSQQHERAIRWNDDVIGVNWLINKDNIILSHKDKISQSFEDAIYFD
jgi:dTDP-4-dehydrorhamnose 3,5-epimerase